MIKLCEYEDINKADCINCFNGLPTNECKHYEEIEGKKLRQMVHERAERDRKKVHNKAIDEAMVSSANAICIGCGYLDGTECKYKGGNCGVSKPMLETVMKALEQLKVVE